MIWPSSNLYRHLVNSARGCARPFSESREDLCSLLEPFSSASAILIGEASHGTQDFYHLRAALTKCLIQYHGLTAVAVEADWPDAYRVNRYVRDTNDDADADSALGGFKRFPQWMWRNRDVLEFVEWLRTYNRSLGDDSLHCGFYGMDLYSMYTSIGAVLDYLDKTDADAAHSARYRYGCLEHFGEDPQAYGYAASFNIERSYEQASAVETLEATAPFVPEEAETFPTGI